jgi:S-adenosylmethionine:tRNA ribosyltransferase-isomerase
MEFTAHILDYHLPEERIAKFPLSVRHDAKLLVYKDQQITHDRFYNLYHQIEEGSLMVFNDTRVFHARMYFTSITGKVIELFCMEPADGKDPVLAMAANAHSEWICMVGGAKKWKSDKLICRHMHHQTETIVEASLIARKDDMFHISFEWSNNDLSFADILEKAGELPLPPYMNRKANAEDENRYQTVYAKQTGSVAAPTAGLHFTDEVLTSLKEKNIETEFVTLHVGAGTFKPVKTNNYKEHEMHAELIDVSDKSIEMMMHHLGKIIVVGTTSLRTLESLYWMGVKAMLNPNASINELSVTQWEAYELPQSYTAEQALSALLQIMKKLNCNRIICKTQIMITPHYKLKVGNGLITNFHQPKSTLLLLIAAVTGKDWEKIYAEALSNDYRFLSYGDSSLLMKSNS